VIFVNEMMTDDNHRVSWPEDTPERLQSFEACVGYGQVLRTVTGEMQYGPGARDWWDKWYCTRPISREADIRGFHKSKPVILLKIATLVALSERPELIVNVSDLEVALALIDKTEIHLHKVFLAIGRNTLNQIAQKVLGWLETCPMMDYRTPTGIAKARMLEQGRLKELMYKEAPARECEEIMTHLLTTERIFFYQAGTRVMVGLKV
jgi:hypothetical protein